jgi:methylated-DNA-[protein]-cysteine S-methyltransferase
MTAYCRYASPLGELLAFFTADALTGLYFVDQKHLPRLAAEATDASSLPLARRLGEVLSRYFAHPAGGLSVPLAPRGTAFQLRVWRALGTISCGETRTYGELAVQVGVPKAARAVGAAVGQNPIAILIPCHRVLGADGRLSGYAGGLARKAALLTLEGRPAR